MNYQRARRVLEERSEPIPFAGCRIWTGSINRSGYGSVSVGGTLFLAHRLAYIAHRGPIPDGLFVCHRCDVKPCINPEHMFLGTNSENLLDARDKGHLEHLLSMPKAQGEAHGSAKLTTEDVLEIRAATGTQKQIAARFGVNRSVISRIRGRVLWAHLP